ncbi:HD domain-containing phosphohydrolase [Vibrio olivae]|uniref:HD domain-containing phosphohydrolase n=1 Tax=Vibrio olivae TaxID=1243002 RepID=A0ABV5HNH7_9VIBR
MKKQRYSLSIHITNLFLVVTFAIGAVLIGISYYYAQKILTGTAKELAYENSSKLQSTFRQETSPILTSLDLIALHPSIRDRRPPLDQPHLLASIKLIFERSPYLASMFYSNEHGDMILFRLIRNEQDSEKFSAPTDTALLVHHTQATGLSEYFYLNNELTLIQSKRELDNQFDPRQRHWFKEAKNDGKIRLSQPYLFYFLKANGVTFSRRSDNGQAVIGADFTLQSLSDQISEIGHSDHSRLALFDNQFRLLAHHQAGIDRDSDSQDLYQALQKTVFKPVLNRISSETLYENLQVDGEEWSVTLTPVKLTDGVQLLLAEATPQNTLLGDLREMRNTQISFAIGLLLLSFFVVWWVARRLAKPLIKMVELTGNIARFDFKRTRYPKSVIKEVADLTDSIKLMEHTLHGLLGLLRETAGNDDFKQLAKTIAHQSYLVTKAETIILYTLSTKKNAFSIAANHAIIPFKIDLDELLKSTAWLLTGLKKGDIIHLNRHDNALKKYQDCLYNSDIYLFPLLNREKQLVGVLLIGYERKLTKQQADKHAFLSELLSFAEIAKENIDRMQQQKDVLNAFIELIASAIDTKSPYTGSHCQRIPVLTNKITQAADNDQQYYPHFSMSPSQWEELRLAAWLHDCGKITTPEYVIDKATKLETIYDRIHEVRMRFELLKMQAEKDYWQQLAKGGDTQQLDAIRVKTQQALDEEFAFIAQCNKGSEKLDDESLLRLQQIGQRQWTRTLDDQLGISWVEKQRAGEKAPLPVQETLLSDKDVHLIPWDYDRSEIAKADEFVLKPGDYKYNRGELYNLSIAAGTLNTEERFIINDHIIQTITMLKRLPFPEHLKHIPEIAGNHHERMDGKGYPRGLNEEQLSIPARAMAIADVFEALTSNDRPYKKAKTLAESIEIMTHMATSGHIDPKLYLLFLQTKIDQSYGQIYLTAEQYTSIDRDAHIQRVKAYIRAQF